MEKNLKRKSLAALQGLAVVIIVLGLATGLSIGLDFLKIRGETILLIYILALMAITLETKSILFPLLGSVASLLLFNFFFVDPRYSLLMTDPNAYISLAIFFIVSAILFSITVQMQRQIRFRQENEKRLRIISDLSTRLLKCKTDHDVYEAMSDCLRGYFKERFLLFIASDKGLLPFAEETPLLEPTAQKALDFTFSHNFESGRDTAETPYLPYAFFPISDQKIVYGVLEISFPEKKGKFQPGEKDMIRSIVSSSAFVIARNRAICAEREATLTVENEKFKTAILRSLSHDIRTPLTAIESGSSLLLDDYGALDDTTKKETLSSINGEAIRLTAFVENLLSLTKLSNAQVALRKKKELVSDLISEATDGLKLRLGEHRLIIDEFDSSLSVPCDSGLIVQVLRNLIDNAIVHTRGDAFIRLSVDDSLETIVFRISDNGGGISKDALDKLFSEFSTIASQKGDKYRGSGLGLSICKSIIEAHQGKILGYNNPEGGATFEFSLPKALQ